VVSDLTEKVRSMGAMTEFRELALEEQWSGAINTPELKAAYNAI
jgi:F420-non-reducing hydrogenase iron-sulfur subunit